MPVDPWTQHTALPVTLVSQRHRNAPATTSSSSFVWVLWSRSLRSDSPAIFFLLTYVGASLVIGKAPLTVTADAASRVYGDANPVFTASFSGFKNGETLATSGVTGSPSLTTTATPASAVGGYPITAALGE